MERFSAYSFTKELKTADFFTETPYFELKYIGFQERNRVIDLMISEDNIQGLWKSYNFSIDNHNYSCLAKVYFTKFVNIEFIYYLCNIKT